MNAPGFSDAADRLAGATIEICARLRMNAEERRRDEAEIALWEKTLGKQTPRHASIGARFAELLRTVQLAAREAITEAMPDLVKEFVHHEHVLGIQTDKDAQPYRRFDRIVDGYAALHERKIDEERDKMLVVTRAVSLRESYYDLEPDGLDIVQRINRLVETARQHDTSVVAQRARVLNAIEGLRSDCPTTMMTICLLVARDERAPALQQALDLRERVGRQQARAEVNEEHVERADELVSALRVLLGRDVDVDLAVTPTTLAEASALPFADADGDVPF